MINPYIVGGGVAAVFLLFRLAEMRAHRRALRVADAMARAEHPKRMRLDPDPDLVGRAPEPYRGRVRVHGNTIFPPSSPGDRGRKA